MNTYEFKTRYNYGTTALQKQFQEWVWNGISSFDLQEFITLAHTHRITLGLIYSEYLKLDDNFMWTKKKAIPVVWKPTLGVSQVGESSAKMSICSQNEATKATRSTWEQPSWDSGHCLFPSLYFLNYFLLHISQGRNFKTSCTWKAQKLCFAMTLIIFLLHYCDQPMWACVCTCILYMLMCAVCTHMWVTVYSMDMHVYTHMCELCVPKLVHVCACVCYVCDLPPILLGPSIELESKHDDIQPNLNISVVPYHYQPESMLPVLANTAIWHSSPVTSKLSPLLTCRAAPGQWAWKLKMCNL